MNWITNYVRPKINSMFGRREVSEHLWIKCPETGEMVFHRDLEENQWVIPASGYHMKMTARDRLAQFFDDRAYELLPQPKVPQDPLKFRDTKKYVDRLREHRAKTELDDAVIAAEGKVGGIGAIACVHDFNFIAGSLGVAAGEAIIAAFETAVKRHLPLVMFPASGGARMQEGILSLMQLPRTTVAVEMLKEAGLPYIVVLTNPTTGGVSASYAMLGDIHLAEPGAEIGFAGRRVIMQTIREELPDAFQTSEYLLEHGMIDMVVHRHHVPSTVTRLLRMLMKAPALETTQGIDAAAAEKANEEADAVVAAIVADDDARTQDDSAEKTREAAQ